MSLDADSIVDRRRMRRRLTFWRVLAVLIAICAVVAIGAALRAPGTSVLTGGPGGSIARVTITGLIRGDQDRVEALERLGKSRARAVIVHINSPGGTTSGSEQLHDALLRLKADSALGMTKGARLMLSTPPAIIRPASPARMARAAVPTASRPEPHRRLMVAPGTSTGRPASRPAMWATLRLSSPAWLAQP